MLVYLLKLKCLVKASLPDEVQWLILVPSPPPGPALVQQVQVVLCSVRSDWIFAVVLPLTRKDTQSCIV